MPYTDDILCGNNKIRETRGIWVRKTSRTLGARTIPYVEVWFNGELIAGAGNDNQGLSELVEQVMQAGVSEGLRRVRVAIGAEQPSAHEELYGVEAPRSKQ